MNVQKMLSLDYASQRERNKVTTAAMVQRLQEREGDTGSTVVQSEWNVTPTVVHVLRITLSTTVEVDRLPRSRHSSYH